MRRFFASFVVFVAAFVASSAFAGPLEETFVGGTRGASQDALSPRAGWDFFLSASNPAWSPDKSAIAIGVGMMQSTLGDRADLEKPVSLLVVGGQKVYGERNATGFLASFPLGSGSMIETSDGLQKQPLWTNRARAFSLQPYYARHMPGIGLSVGVSVPVSFHIDSLVEVKTPDQDSYARQSTGLTPAVSLGVGAYYYGLRDWTFSLAYGAEQTATADATLDAQVPFTSGNALRVEMYGEMVYAYTPHRLVAQADYAWSGSFTTGVMARYSLWSRMPSPFLNLSDSSPKFELAEPDFDTQNTWEVGAGAVYRAGGDTSIFASYRYQPTPLVSGSDGFFDADQHVVGLGLGWLVPFTLDQLSLSVRLHKLKGGGYYTWAGIGLGSEL